MDYAVLDIEAVGEPWDGRLLCVGWRDRALIPPRRGDGGRFDLEWLRMLDELADPNIAKVVMTLYDHRWLRLAGWDVRGPIYDVQTLAWVLNENTDLDLATITRLYCPAHVKEPRIRQVANRPVFKRDDGVEVPLEEAPMSELLAYNEGDLVSTAAVFESLKRRVIAADEGLPEFFEDDCLPLTPVLLDMMVRGLPVDVPAAMRLRDELARECSRLDRELKRDAGLPPEFNLGSGPQVASFLYSKEFEFPMRVPLTEDQRAELKTVPRVQRVDYARSSGFGLPRGFDCGVIGNRYAHGTRRIAGLGLKVRKKTDGGRPATDAKTLKVYHGDHPWVAQYLELAKRRTIVSSFLNGIERRAHRGRLFGTFKQPGTVTGRLSSSGPNLQNQPSKGDFGRRVRSLFRPQPGFEFVHGDYGQLEPRLMAHLSGDPVLTAIFQRGEDVYLRTAEEVFGYATPDLRSMMKTYVLAMGYGAGADKLRETLALEGFYLDAKEVRQTLERLRGVYAVYFDWKDATVADAAEVGYVPTLGGHHRRIELGRATSWRGLEARKGRQAANSAVQGTAAEVVGRTMVNLRREFPDLHLIAAVHDEILGEAEAGFATPEVLARIETIATSEHGFDLNVPLEFKPRVIPTWAEGKD